MCILIFEQIYKKKNEWQRNFGSKLNVVRAKMTKIENFTVPLCPQIFNGNNTIVKQQRK